MISQLEFEFLLAGYLNGTSSLTERQLIKEWSQQFGEGETAELTAAELVATRARMWARLQELMGPERRK